MNIPIKKRFLLVLGAVAIQCIYTPTSLLMTGGIEPKLALDVFPLEIEWVIPYVLCYPLWVIAGLWLIMKTDDRLFRAVVAGFYFTFSLGVATYLLFPTYVVHPVITGNDLLSKLLLYLTVMGGDYDALPSAHIYMTVVLALFYRDWYPRYKWLWLLIVVIISFSTLFTRQHYILDVLGGYLTGWLGYRLGLWWSNSNNRLKYLFSSKHGNQKPRTI